MWHRRARRNKQKSRNIGTSKHLGPYFHILWLDFHYMPCIMLQFLLWLVIKRWIGFFLFGLPLLMGIWVDLSPVPAATTSSSRRKIKVLEGYILPWEPEDVQNRQWGGILMDVCFFFFTLSLRLNPGTVSIEQISCLHPWPYSFSHYPVFMTTGEGGRVNQPQNGELCRELSSAHYSFHLLLSYEQDLKIAKLLHLRQQLFSDLE